jgi:hypothetical protein
MRRAEAVEHCRFSMVQIRELQNDLATRWPSVPFVHMSGLHAAVMHNRGVSGCLDSKSALAMLHSLTLADCQADAKRHNAARRSGSRPGQRSGCRGPKVRQKQLPRVDRSDPMTGRMRRILGSLKVQFVCLNFPSTINEPPVRKRPRRPWRLSAPERVSVPRSIAVLTARSASKTAARAADVFRSF